jgi:hypothetical protein
VRTEQKYFPQFLKTVDNIHMKFDNESKGQGICRQYYLFQAHGDL